MLRAIELAQNGRFGAHPNPMVGAVLAKGGRIVGEGWHGRFGGPHAEINALASAGKKARGSTAYVTLEPCSTYGKTPPCTAALVSAGVKEVVYGASDPNPANHGRAAKLLRAAGIKTRGGVERALCEAINPAFNKLMRTGLPYVTIKIAQSMDGKIADASGNAKWISAPQSRVKTHELRAESDAVITGINTILADDAQLDVRFVKADRQPLRVVMDSRLRIPPSSKIVTGAHGNALTLIACVDGASSLKRRALEKLGCEVMAFDSRDGRVPPELLLAELGRRGLSTVMIEAGAEITGAFTDLELADRYIFFVAPTLLGGQKALPSLGGKGIIKSSEGLLGLRFSAVNVGLCGSDIVLEGIV